MLRQGFAAVLAACAAAFAIPAAAQYSPFYAATEAELQGPPGSVIRWERMMNAPWNSKGYRMLYRSTGLNGEPIAVSGVIVIPDGAPPEGGFPVLAWAHPTTGVADKCAPSLELVLEVFKTIPGLDEAVKNNWVVVGTDYPGLGTAGEHPYLVGISEARAVLDSVRAARQLANASNRFGVWGHSQGGHAALWTGEIAHQYAPDLELVGIAAAAPASLLGELFDDDLKTVAGKGLTALAMQSWSILYDLPLQQIVRADQIASVQAIGSECLAGFTDIAVDVAGIAHLSDGPFLAADPVTTPPWSHIVADNTPGKLASGGPVFLAQGTADTVVDPPVTRQFAIELCGQNVPVTFHEVPDATHDVIAKVSATHAMAWMADRFAGQAAPTNCIKN